MMTDRGFTLVEALIVMSIIVVLVLAMGFSFVGWYGGYRAESALKDLYSDLLETRLRAMQRNRAHFADFNFPVPAAGQGRYRIAEVLLDVNGYEVLPGDGDNNGVIDPVHTVLPTFPKDVQFNIVRDDVDIITFDKRGMISGQQTICMAAAESVEPDYDCITVSQTRINMGRLMDGPPGNRVPKPIGQGGVCNAASCDAK